MKFVAGIVLYNPNIKRLNNNINSVSPQVDRIILFDNGSKNIDEIIEFLDKKNITYDLLKSEKNFGIAYALNRICEFAKSKEYNWILTLDQDTVISDNLINQYKKYVNLPNVGQLSCVYRDRNSKKVKDAIDKRVTEVKECITSGALLNLDALKTVGGFDENMFIDYVDFDLCYALRKENFKTYRINYIGMLHEIGHITTVNFFLKKIEIFNQSSFRHYYRCRNFFLFSKRYKIYSSRKAIYIQLKELIKVILYENNKLSKTKIMIKGIHDGMKMDPIRKKYLR